jgi:hypothetical protein
MLFLGRQLRVDQDPLAVRNIQSLEVQLLHDIEE